MELTISTKKLILKAARAAIAEAHTESVSLTALTAVDFKLKPAINNLESIILEGTVGLASEQDFATQIITVALPSFTTDNYETIKQKLKNSIVGYLEDMFGKVTITLYI